MLGLFGAIDLVSRARGGHLDALADEMARRLTGPQEGLALQRCGRLSLGRAGAAHHHNMPWRSQAGAPAIAGILQGEPEDAQALALAEPASLRGFFAAVLQRPNGGVAIIADRRASVPVFYAEVEGMLLFAPEVKCLLAARTLPRDPDQAAMASFLASGHLIGAQTLFASVRRLRGGEAIRIAPDGALSVERYWRFRPGVRAGSSGEAELAVALLEGMEAAVARNLALPEKSFVFLSGGADSRGVFCAALRALPADRITAVTWTRDGGGQRSDLDIAAKVAGAARVRHVVLTSRPRGFAAHFSRSNAMIDCLSDSAPAHPYFALIGEELMERGLHVGLRGDEAFGWWRPVSSLAEALTAVGLRSIDQSALGPAIRAERLDAIASAQWEALAALGREVDGLTPNQMKDSLYFEHRLQTYLGAQNRLLTSSIDHRNPLLDEDLLEFMELVPDSLRTHKLLYQRALSRRYDDLWKLGLAGRSARPEWAGLIACDAQIVPALEEALADTGSGIWDYLSRDHMIGVLDRLARREPRRRSGWKPIALSLYRSIRPRLPRKLSELATRRQLLAKPVGPALQLWRMLALKHWHDVLRIA